MKKNEGRLVGILGAIIIHLIAGIIFVVVKMGSLNISEYTKEYQIALESVPVPDKIENRPELKTYSVEQVLRGDAEMLNIARNLANQPDVKINPSDYIDKVKEELIQSGKLGKDNYIDEQKKQKEVSKDEVAILNKDDPKGVEKKPDKSQEMAANYSGPTRIYYNLKGRTHSYLPIPIYKCEGSGKVVLAIEVNPKGVVLNATILTAESTTTDPCLIETAVSSALISRFNPDANIQKSQSGTLTYHFVAQ